MIYLKGEKFPNQKVFKVVEKTAGGSLVYSDKELTLYLGVPKLRKREINEFHRGVVRFAVYPNEILNTSLLLICFGQDLVFDLIYDINVLAIDVDGTVDSNRLMIYLVDTETGILEGIRALGLGEQFMSEINKITLNDRRYTPAEYTEWIKSLYKYDIWELWRMSNRVDWDR